MTEITLGLTASAIAAKLDEWPRRRVKLDELQALLVAAEPALTHSPERRARLADIIDELADAGVVQLPSERSYDRTARPRLPRFVQLNRDAPAPRRRAGAEIAWLPELSWAAELRFDEQTLSDLRNINAFLRDGGPDRPVVPLRERSVQVLGDEKRLEMLMGGQLFRPGRLTLDLLRCEEVHPPFVYEHVGDGRDALVVENHHTYVSLARALAGDAQIGFIIYGAGAHFKGSVTFISDLPRRPRRVLYFGDLDIDGLGIPVHASAVAAATGLPRVEPATWLYELLLDYGRPALVDVAPSRYRVKKLCAWLAPDARGRAETMLTAGHRLAQEWVGTELLRDHTERRSEPGPLAVAASGVIPTTVATGMRRPANARADRPPGRRSL